MRLTVSPMLCVCVCIFTMCMCKGYIEYESFTVSPNLYLCEQKLGIEVCVDAAPLLLKGKWKVFYHVSIHNV